MVQLQKFQMTNATNWKGLTSENHLGTIFKKQTQKASDIMIQVLATNRGKNLETYLSKFPIKEFDSDDEYTWELIGSSRRNIPVKEARDFSGDLIESGMVGANYEPFYLVFPEDWFADGNVIVGEKNEMYPIRIMQEPTIEGTDAVYKCELMGGVSAGIPFDEVSYGKLFSVEYSPVEKEMSRGVGDIRFSSPIAMRNEFSTIRIKHKVPGSALTARVAVGIPFVDKSGKKMVSNTWMHHVDYKVEETFSDEKAFITMYGRSNRSANGEYKNFGKSGNVIKQGAGLRELMEVANTIYYPKFSLKLIEEALYELSATKLGMNERIFVLRTGERGAAKFHKAVLDVVSGWTAIGYLGGNAANPAIISRTNSDLHTNALSAGFQFTEFKAPNGVIVKVEVDPFYDDPVRNKILHPEGGVAESYRYDILYIGSMDQPNIQLARVRNLPELRGYRWGLRNPFTGKLSNDNMSWDEDSAEIHKMATLGVFILDSTRTMSIIPNILR